MDSMNATNPKGFKNSSSGSSKRQWSLPRRLISMGFTGLHRTTSNIESRSYARSNGVDQSEDIKYIDDVENESIKEELFGEFGFTVEQVCEMQGLSIASAIQKTYPNVVNNKTIKVLICCGTDLLGKSGLVAARHLKLFGFRPTIYNPQPGKSAHYHRLIRQSQEFEISFLSYLPNESRLISESYELIVDVMEDYSQSFSSQSYEILAKLVEVCNSGTPVISVDVPYGWDMNEGPPRNGKPILFPECLISLIAPKKCSKLFTGRHHWLGGRFILPSLSRKYKLNSPKFDGSEQTVAIGVQSYCK